MERLKMVLKEHLLPEGNACHLCGRGLEEAGILCARCVSMLNADRFPPARCVHPRPHPPIRLCLSAFPHAGMARELVHLLKYVPDPAAAAFLGESMALCLAASPVSSEAFDAVVPVPLHISRLELRGCNQAQLLAETVCRHLALAPVQNALTRVHATDTQLRRSREARLNAMKHAFAAEPSMVRGRHILLVDDVLTTGATAMSCARVLMKAGAKDVTLLTACRA